MSHVGSITLAVFTGILILSLYIGRISPNGFRRDFPLALLLFSQVYLFLRLLIGVGYYSIFVVLPLVFGFWGANLAYESIANSKLNGSLSGFLDSSWSSVAYILYSVVVLTRIIGSINLVKGNMAGIVLLVSVYSLVLPVLVNASHMKLPDRQFVLNFFLVAVYYALIGYALGYLSGWGLVGALFLAVLYIGVVLSLWATFVFKSKLEKELSPEEGSQWNTS